MELYNETMQRRRAVEIVDQVMLKYRDDLIEDPSRLEFVSDYRFGFAVGLSRYQPYDDETMYGIIFGRYKGMLERDMQYSTFYPLQSMVYLLMRKESLPLWLVDYFERYVKFSMPINTLSHVGFIGVNDNTPAMIMALCILAGEYFDNAEWKRVGLDRLSEFEQMIEDRTFISEFTSPTYSPITIYALAQLANLSIDGAVKSRAIRCEQAMWRQTLLVWHRGTSKYAGPYSRAYHVDSVGHTSLDRLIAYQVMGERMSVNALNTTFREGGFDELQIHGRDKDMAWFMELENVNLCSAIYHCPPEYIEEAYTREYPVFIKGKAQLSASADLHLVPVAYGQDVDNSPSIDDLRESDELHEYPACVSEIFSYISDYYTLGTCTKEFHNGIQADSLYMLIADKKVIDNQEDMTTLFTRYTVNDATRIPTLKSDMGRKIAYSYLNDGIVLYTPKVALQEMMTNGIKAGGKFSEITSLKCQVLIDDRFGNIKGIEANGQSLEVGEEIDSDTAIYVRFDKVYVALYPVAKGRKVRIEKEDSMISISLIDYEGEAKHFTRKGLKLINSGYVVRARSVDEIGSFDEFKTMCDCYEVSDVLYANLHTRFAVERKTKFSGRGITLESSYSPVSEGIRYIRANGRLLDAER